MFFSEHGYRPHVAGVYGHQGFQKRSPEWRLLKTETYRICVDGRKRRFLNTMTSCLGSEGSLFGTTTIRKRQIYLNMEGKVSVFENTRLSVDGRIRFENGTCGRRFFLNTEKKKYPFSKILGYIWTGLNIHPLLTIMFKNVLTTFKSEILQIFKNIQPQPKN